MTAKANTCEGSDGTDISTSNTAPDQWSAVNKTGTGATVKFATAQNHTGSSCMDVHAPLAVSMYGYGAWTGLSSTANAFARMYVRKSANPVSISRVISFYGGGSHRCSLAILASGAIRTYNAAGAAIASSTGTIPSNAWARLEFEVTGISGSTGLVAARIYSGSNLEGATPDTNGSLSTAGASIGGNVDEVDFGITNNTSYSTAWDILIDDCAYSDVAQPGALVIATDFEGWGVPV